MKNWLALIFLFVIIVSCHSSQNTSGKDNKDTTTLNVIKINLPDSTKSKHLGKPAISLTVTSGHKYYLDSGNDSIPAKKLKAAIKKRVEGIVEPVIAIYMDKSLTVQCLVDVLQIGKDLSVKMVLAQKAAIDK